jgi:hypothetical protein
LADFPEPVDFLEVVLELVLADFAAGFDVVLAVEVFFVEAFLSVFAPCAMLAPATPTRRAAALRVLGAHKALFPSHRSAIALCDERRMRVPWRRVRPA